MTGLAIYDLRYGQCKFAVTPFDATLHLFCGEPVEYEGCPYCPEHAARCFDRRTDEQKRLSAERSALARAIKEAQVQPGDKRLIRPKF